MRRRSDAAAQDIGFGKALSEQRGHRLINRDGTINAVRAGGRRVSDRFTYASILQMSWPAFLAWVCVAMLLINVAFSLGYFFMGPQALAANGPSPGVGGLYRCFFFSIHTFTTIGYGNIVPVGLRSNVLVVIEAFVGFFTYALATGLVFARFTRPVSRIRFSASAVITPGSNPALLIRVTNLSQSELIQMEATITASFFQTASAHARSFYPLKLERSSIALIPLSWTITHVIDATSPLYELTASGFTERRGELFVHVKAIDQSSSQMVYARRSYIETEIVWNAEFQEIYQIDTRSGLMTMDLERFDHVAGSEPEAEHQPPQELR